MKPAQPVDAVVHIGGVWWAIVGKPEAPPLLFPNLLAAYASVRVGERIVPIFCQPAWESALRGDWTHVAEHSAAAVRRRRSPSRT